MALLRGQPEDGATCRDGHGYEQSLENGVRATGLGQP